MQGLHQAVTHSYSKYNNYIHWQSNYIKRTSIKYPESMSGLRSKVR